MSFSLVFLDYNICFCAYVCSAFDMVNVPAPSVDGQLTCDLYNLKFCWGHLHIVYGIVSLCFELFAGNKQMIMLHKSHGKIEATYLSACDYFVVLGTFMQLRSLFSSRLSALNMFLARVGFSVSIIHRTLTWTTGSLMCTCDLFCMWDLAKLHSTTKVLQMGLYPIWRTFVVECSFDWRILGDNA